MAKPIRMQRIFLAGILALAINALARADTNEVQYNQIHFQATASEQVLNDKMQATLMAYGEDKRPESLADSINRTMDWALNIANDVDNVEAKTGAYQTYPVHQKNSLKGWRGSQELVLVAGDFGDLGSLVGTLQERLQVKSMSFSLFPQTRTVVEDQLIFAALNKFKDRAELVRQNLGASGYRIVEININTGATMPRPVPMMRAQAASMEAVAAPAVSGGESTVSVTVSGTVQLD